MKFGYVSWLPQTSSVEKFLESLKEGRIVGSKCRMCQEIYVPPREDCRCGSEELDLIDVRGRGKLRAFIHVNFPPESMSKYAPYTIGIVELENGKKLLGHITGVTPQTLKIGMELQAVQQQLDGDRLVYKFKPA